MFDEQLMIMDASQATRLNIDWPDVYFTPAYGRAVETLRNWDWRLALWTSTTPIIFPFLMRPIDRTITGGNRLFDAVSPYGYSGTAALEAAPPDDWRAFRQAWRETAIGLGVVGEFQRFSPFVAGRGPLCSADTRMHARQHNTIVTVSCHSIERYWESASSMVRNRVRRARKLGYEAVVSSAADANLAAGSPFRDIYEQTMERVNATADFVFSDEYYASLHRHLGDALQICRVVDRDGRTVSAGLFFHWGTVTHFHLAGSDLAARKDGCNILRLDTQIRWASDAGSQVVNLGGGRADNDGLFRFKANFGDDYRPFYVGTAILNDSVSNRLAAHGYAP